MKRLYSKLLIPLSLFCSLSLELRSENIILEDNSTIHKQNSNNLVLSTNNIDKNNFEIILSGIGINPDIEKDISSKLITLRIKTKKQNNFNSFQSLSVPSAGIKTLTLSTFEDNIKIVIKAIDQATFSEPDLIFQNEKLKMIFPKIKLPIDTFSDENIFSLSSKKELNNRKNLNRASAPPLGDIAVGTTFIPNLKTINLDGPDVSIIFKDTTAKSAIEFLLSQTNYGYVWVQNDPTFLSKIDNGQELGTNLQESNIPSPLVSETENEEKVSDSPRYITMTLKNQPFSVAFNSILMSSGLEAKIENGIVYVGPDVQDRIFSERISRIYRLNQTTANAAASYLANLGAKVTQTNTITTAVTSGASESQAVSGAASSATTNEQTTTSVTSYGGNEGPLQGLIATTDDRLQTITLVGTRDLISVAETYIKQLDLRQRQVALTVKILDVDISDGTNLNSSWAFRQNNKFIVNSSGILLGAINNFLPPTSIPSPAASNRADTYNDQQFINSLRADILSQDTKIIASPTLILNEFPGSTGGDTVTFSSVNDTLKAGTIGRSYGNEAFIIVGTQVPINCTFDAESGVATLEYGISGLTFGARIIKIDDNGYVTFSISPAISSTSDQRPIANCATVDLLNTRRLDSGSIRVKDGNTLILTGVLDSTENETIRKFPILGDIPILGQLFRSTTSSKGQRELVILVTPQILNSTDSISSDIGFNPSSQEVKGFVDENLKD